MKKPVSIFDYRTGVEFLSAVYKSIAERNCRYSMRSFAQRIDLDQSTLVRYFAKERFMSSDKCAVVADRLKLNEIETHYFKLLTMFGDKGDFEILEKLRAAFLFHEIPVSQTTRDLSQQNDLAIAKSVLQNLATSNVEIYTSKIAVKAEGRVKLLRAVQNLHGVISEYKTEEAADDVFLVSSFMVNLTNSEALTPIS